MKEFLRKLAVKAIIYIMPIIAKKVAEKVAEFQVAGK